MGFSNFPLLSFIKNKIQTPVSLDTVTPANSEPLPVLITGANGSVNINAGNLSLEVQTSGFGPFPDSMQITDGTDTLAINPDGSINTDTTAGGQAGVGRVTLVTINNTGWTALPATPLANRNAFCIQNRSGQEIKINYTNTDPGYVGMTIDFHGERNYDIGPAIIMYAKSISSSCVVNVEEIS